MKATTSAAPDGQLSALRVAEFLAEKNNVHNARDLLFLITADPRMLERQLSSAVGYTSAQQRDFDAAAATNLHPTMQCATWARPTRYGVLLEELRHFLSIKILNVDVEATVLGSKTSPSTSPSRSPSRGKKSDISETAKAIPPELRALGCKSAAELEASEVDVMKTPSRMSLGCATLDALLFGGLPRGTVTELSGEAGAGKTQIALQTLLTHASISLKTRAVYLVAEDIPHSRLTQIAEGVVRRLKKRDSASWTPSGADSSSSIPTPEELLERLFIRKVESPQDIFNSFNALRGMVRTSGGAIEIGLVVIDSIAAAVLQEQDTAENNARLVEDAELMDDGQPEGAQAAGRRRRFQRPGSNAKMLFSIGAACYKFASELDLAILILNQVRSKPGVDRPIPALGLNWAYVPHTKLHVSIYRGPLVDSDSTTDFSVGENRGRPRIFKVAASSYLPVAETRYIISTAGVESC